MTLENAVVTANGTVEASFQNHHFSISILSCLVILENPKFEGNNATCE
jgi:hypothetical protein